ncbi:MAG: methyltransferase domain-containing protein [Verrucomicrobia bacterium]|nr:methyltransferase domain-containing protein [Verrucomicrobiota bacterium]
MATDPKDYILGTSDEEIQRLGYQHQVWSDSVLPLWKKAGFNVGQEILDLGCGPGFASRDLANLVGPKGKIFAVDASEKFIHFLNQQLKTSAIKNISTQVSDVHALDLPSNRVDGVFARWVMCFVKNPEKVISEAVRVLRPGGSLVIMDYFNYLSVNIFPNRESFTKLFRAYHESLLDHGGTYDIGQFLPQMICENTMEIVSLQPISRIARPGTKIWKWLILFTESHMPKLIEEGYMSRSDRETFLRDWRKASNDPGAFFYPPPIIGIVARKPSP